MIIFDINRYDGLGVAELIRTGDISAIEVSDATLAQNSTMDPNMNSV